MNPMDQLRTLFVVKGVNPATGRMVVVELVAKTATDAKLKAEEVGLKAVVVTPASRQSEAPSSTLPPTD